MNPLLLGHSGTTPEPSRNALNTSQGTNEDDSQNDRRPEAGLFHCQMTQNSGPEERQDSYAACVLVERLNFSEQRSFSIADSLLCLTLLHFNQCIRDCQFGRDLNCCIIGLTFLIFFLLLPVSTTGLGSKICKRDVFTGSFHQS